MKNFSEVREDVKRLGFGGAIIKSALTEQAKETYLPVIEKKHFEKVQRREEKRKERELERQMNESYEDEEYEEENELQNKYEISAYMQKQDGIKRDVIDKDGKLVIVKVGDKKELYDEKHERYGKNMSYHDLIRKDYSKVVVMIKLSDSYYARIYGVRKLDDNTVVANLKEFDDSSDSTNIPDYVLL